MNGIEAWPNGIGWDVGDAEVRDLGNRLRAFVPADDGSCLVCDVPLGTDPFVAVAICREQGVIRVAEEWWPLPVPFVSATQNVLF